MPRPVRRAVEPTHKVAEEGAPEAEVVHLHLVLHAEQRLPVPALLLHVRQLLPELVVLAGVVGDVAEVGVGDLGRGSAGVHGRSGATDGLVLLRLLADLEVELVLEGADVGLLQVGVGDLGGELDRHLLLLHLPLLLLLLRSPLLLLLLLRLQQVLPGAPRV